MKYSTNFATDENPLSESGSWIQGGATGLDWTNVRTLSGGAFGTMDGSTSYNDSVACLSGSWGWHQRARGTYKQTATPLNSTTAFIEIELLLHFTITSHSATGYEATIATSPDQTYVQINRWNGALAAFTLLASGTLATPPATNDIFEFRDEGTSSVPLLRIYRNGDLLLTYDTTPDVTKYTAGSPGCGFYDGQGGAAGPTNAGQGASTWDQFDASDDYFDGECLQSNNSVSASSANALTCAFASNVVAGDQLVCVAYDGATGTTLAVTDTQGNAWTTHIAQDQTTDGHRIGIASCVAKSSAACTVTSTWSGTANNFRNMSIAEYKQGWSADKNSSGQGSGTTASSGATAVPSVATELLVAGFGGNNGAALSSSNPSAQGGYFRRQTPIASNGSWGSALFDRIIYSASAQTATAGMASQNWSALIQTFQLAIFQSLVNYRYRNDDGTETTATWRAPELTDISVVAGERFRLRFQIDTTGDEPSQPLTLQFRRFGDTAWTTVSNITKLQFADSVSIASAAATATTTQLTAPAGKSGNFTVGKISDDTNPIIGVDIALSFYSEFEFSLRPDISVTSGDRYEFQLSGTSMTNTVTPRITIAPALRSSQVGFQVCMG